MSKGSNNTSGEGNKKELNENDEFTVRLNQNEDSTVRIDAVDDATVRIHNDNDSTVRINSSSNVAQDTDFPQNTIVLKGVEYRIERTISESTGEARIELLKRNNELSVLKLYFSSVKPKLELVDKLKNLVHQNIIKIFEYGNYNSDSGEQRFFERMEYAQGGTAEELMPIKDVDFIKRVIASVTEGLDYIHKKGVIHRDIKPGNLFFRDKEQSEIIISDFGISSLKNLEDDLHLTVNKAFTKFYSAPETLSIEDKIVIEPKLDFYSLGLTILRLWYGKNLYKGLPDHIITTMKFDNKLLDPNFIDDAFPRELLSLVRGLTLVNRENRWGANEVRKWLKGELVDIVNDITSIEPRRPFEFDKQEGLIANSTKELAQMLFSHKELGIKYLYRGKISDWLKESDPKTQTLIDDIVEDQFKDDKNAGLQAAVYLLDKAFPYYDINGKACADHIGISYALESNRKEYHRRLQNKSDNFYIYWRSQNNAKFAEYCYNVINDSKTPPELAILKIVYSINPDFPFPLGQGTDKHFIQSPNELIPYAKENGKLNIIKALEDGTLLVWFESLEDCNELSKAVRNAQAKSFSSEWIISIISYHVDEGAGYFGYEKAPAKVYSKEDLALHLLEYTEVYSAFLKEGNDIPLFDFMISRGWEKHLELLKEEINSTGYEYVPLNDDLRFAIIARDLDPNVPYKFKNGIAVTSKDELLEIISDVKQEVAILLDNDDAKFTAWLQSQFHYKLDYKHEDANEFNKRLKEYIDFRAKLYTKDKKLKLYKKAFRRTERLYENARKLKRLHIVFSITSLIIFAICLSIQFDWLRESDVQHLYEYNSNSFYTGIKAVIGITVALLLLSIFFYFKRFKTKVDIKSIASKEFIEEESHKIALSYAAINGHLSLIKYQNKNLIRYNRARILRLITIFLLIILIPIITYRLPFNVPYEHKFLNDNKHLATITDKNEFNNLVNSLKNNEVYIAYADSGYIRLMFNETTDKNILKFEFIRDYWHNINRGDDAFGFYNEKTGEVKLASTRRDGEYILNFSNDFSEINCSMDKSISDYFYIKENDLIFKPSYFYQNDWVADLTFLGKDCKILLESDRSLTITFPSRLVEKYKSKFTDKMFTWAEDDYSIRGEGDLSNKLKIVNSDGGNTLLHPYIPKVKAVMEKDREFKSYVEVMMVLVKNELQFDLTVSEDRKTLKGYMYLRQYRTENRTNKTAITFKQVD